MARPATRDRPVYRCGECGAEAAKWVGRCPECQSWGSVSEAGRPAGTLVSAGPVTVPARPIEAVPQQAAVHQPTGIGELDRVLGGGLVPGSVVLLAGEPGVGKSTLLLTAAAAVAAAGRRALLVTGEESAEQVRLRAGRVGALHPLLLLAAETDLAAVLGQVDLVRPELLVVDSVQTIGTPLVDGSPGGVAQVREVAAALTRMSKQRGLTTMLVGHVTKDGSIAGPRVLEHVVDVVLHFEGDRRSRLRLVRTVKNRYGPADEVGCFDLTDDGIVGLADPTRLFVGHGQSPVPGTAITVALEGRRTLLCELQALVGAAPQQPVGSPRRASSGLDTARVAMLLAVTEKVGKLGLASREVYTATVGGVRIYDPAADLALALAVFGAALNTSVRPGLAAVGEVGLAGEVRPVPAVRARVQEAARLGFRTVLVPPGTGTAVDGVDGVDVVEVAELRDARRLALG